MEYIAFMNTIVRHVGMVLEYTGLAIVAGSALLSLIKVLQPSLTMEHVRRHLAKRIIFGLEFVIAADILLATIAVEFDDIIRLGGIVIIRVVLGYALRKEAGLK